MPDQATPAPGLSADAAEKQLTAADGPFEITREVVGGEEVDVFARRLPHLRAILEDSGRFDSRELFIFDTGVRLTAGEHRRRVASVAKILRDTYGVGKGDRVALLGANSPEWIVALWATISLGGIAVAMNGWWQGDEIEYGLARTEPLVLIADRKRLARLEGRDPGVPVVVIEDDFEPLWLDHRDESLPDPSIDEDDPAVILFTSGTTGRPKGAINTHRNILAYLSLMSFVSARGALMAGIDAGADVVPPAVLATSPLFHVSGLHSAAISHVLTGTPSVWTTGRFDPEQIFRLTVDEGIGRWGGVTTAVWRLLEHPSFNDHDFSMIRAVGGGGSTWSPELQRLIREKLPNARFGMSVGYGLTECSALCTLATSADLEAHPDCVGPALPTAEVAILDDTGAAVPDGVDGNVCIRGPMVMPGYWNQPDATAETFFPGGWLKSGDVGQFREGLLFLASRKRDMIIRGGENVYPVEIENRLEEHPGISEAAIIGVDHRELGQEVMAVVVPQPGAKLDPEEVKAFVGETLAYFKVPSYVEVRGEPLPRNAAGKVLKHVLEGGENPFVEE